MPRSFTVLILLSFCAQAGCHHTFLRHAAIHQAETVNELYFEQVMHNIAMFECNPDTLPEVAIINDGTSQLQDGGQVNNNIGWNTLGFASNTLGLGSVSRQLMGNWKMLPLSSAGRIQRLRCAFQLVCTDYPIGFVLNPISQKTKDPCTGVEKEDVAFQLVPVENYEPRAIYCVREMISFGLLPTPDSKQGSFDKKTGVLTFKTPEGAEDYRLKFEMEFRAHFPRCWYGVGSRCEVPRDACYRARYCDVHSWVTGDGINALSLFTMTVINIATTEPTPSKTVQVTRTVRTQSGEKWEIVGNVPLDTAYLKIPDEITKAKQDRSTKLSLLQSAVVPRGPLAADSKIEPVAKLNSTLMNLTERTQVDDWYANFKKATNTILKAADAESQKQIETYSNGIDAAYRAFTQADDRLKTLEQIESTPEIFRPETVDPFDRPLSLPPSRSGIEFVPSISQ